MPRSVLILFITIGLLQTSAVEGACVFGTPVVEWNETIPGGTLMFNSSKDANDHVTFAIDPQNDLKPQYYSNLKQCLVLSTGDTWFALTSNKTLNLEYFYEEWGNATLDSIFLQFSCGTGNPSRVTIQNTPVNQYKPVFKQSPYSTSIPELTIVGTEVYSLTERVTDQDVPKHQIFLFQIQPYNIQQFDGRDYFDMPRSSGKVTLKQALDYDTMDRKYWMLNISVADSAIKNSAKTSYTTLNVTITDDDDQNPEFVKPGCKSPCPVPEYQAIIGLTDTVMNKGAVNVTPPIQAADRDTLDTPLIYRIVSGNQHSLFHMNSVTAIITQQRSVLEERLPDEEFRLVIEVAKQNRTDLHTLGIVRVLVRERMPNYNGTIPELPEPESPPEKKEENDSLLIVVIILGIILLILIIATIIIVVIMRRKRKKTIIRPEDTKSEPHTEEEELPTDRDDHYHEQAGSSEKLVSAIPSVTSGTLTYAELPSGRGGMLPPLPSRDFGTETEEVKNKKRSRRRKKNKELEIFDGTKEYNMGADPEFFDSTDKSKIKRSTRSYHKDTDPQLRLQVPNDQPPNE